MGLIKEYQFVCLFLIILMFNNMNSSLISGNPNFLQKLISDNLDVPLILTPLIKANKIKEAQIAAENHFDGFKGVKSYSGYFTVNKNYDSNLFFWFFPSQTDYKNDPVILWLQGGPGTPSLFGLFQENGPFSINDQDDLDLREFTWTKNHSMIYIDNPVGTGFSFTNGGYCQNTTQIALDLYEALRQFFLLFPELQQNEFYVSGESYAGKFATAISYRIHKKNQITRMKINLKGLTIGNGWIDPINQINYDNYLYQIGLIDLNGKALFQQYEQHVIQYINNKQWIEAFEEYSNLLFGGKDVEQTLFKNLTGLSTYYNYLLTTDDEDITREYVQRNDVRTAIHVGNTTYNSGIEVKSNLRADMMQSVTPWIVELLNHYRVLIYNGQLDIIVPYPLTTNYLQNLKFSGADQYKTAPRYQWYVDDELAGYVKQAGNLTEILVRNAGHMVPQDQPKWAFDLISRFTRNKPYY